MMQGRSLNPALRSFAVMTMVASSLGAAALAHRQAEVVITIDHSAANGRDITEVTTRLHAHDAIKLLGMMGQPSPDLEVPSNMEALGDYVGERISFDGGESAIAVGGEVDGDFVFTYHLVDGHRTIEGATVLSDVAPNWSNLVNGERGMNLRSVTYSNAYPNGYTGPSEE